MNELELHIDRLTAWIKESTRESISWSSILIAESSQIKYGNILLVPRSALSTPRGYYDTFRRHLDSGHTWVNMNAAGILNDALLIVIELPTYKNTVPRNSVSINLSGPGTHVAKEPGWNACAYIRIVE